MLLTSAEQDVQVVFDGGSVLVNLHPHIGVLLFCHIWITQICDQNEHLQVTCIWYRYIFEQRFGWAMNLTVPASVSFQACSQWAGKNGWRVIIETKIIYPRHDVFLTKISFKDQVFYLTLTQWSVKKIDKNVFNNHELQYSMQFIYSVFKNLSLICAIWKKRTII